MSEHETTPNQTAPSTSAAPPARLSRRRFLLAGLGIASAAAVGRACFYSSPAPWRGHLLARREAAVIAAAVSAIIPDVASDELPSGPSAWEVASNVDEYLLAMPPLLRRDVHALLFAVEHLTPLGGRFPRFTRLAPDARAAVLEALSQHPLGRLLYRGMRDLVMLGWYQDARTWEAISYEGPTVGPCTVGRFSTPERTSRYADLIAPRGELPPGAR